MWNGIVTPVPKYETFIFQGKVIDIFFGCSLLARQRVMGTCQAREAVLLDHLGHVEDALPNLPIPTVKRLEVWYSGTLLITPLPPGPYSRTMPKVLGGS